MNQNNFELLLAKDKEKYWEILGITYSNAMCVEPGSDTLRATLLTIEKCKQLLKSGNKIFVSKTHEFPEIQPSDLIIQEQSKIEIIKKIAINEISQRMHQALFSLNVLDLLEFLQNYMSLLNYGCFITDENRENKYFEIIDEAQSIDDPEELSDNASFEDQQKYIEQKQKYITAQNKLSTLEKYLNSCDTLMHYKNLVDFLTDTRKKIETCNTEDEVSTQMNIFRTNVENYKMVN